MKVLAFEDGFDISALLSSGGVDLSGVEIAQYWNSENHQKYIVEHDPDILLLDHFMPPFTGLQVLQQLNIDVAAGAKRPNVIVAMSSDERMNEQLLRFGADFAVIKFELASLKIWDRNTELSKSNHSS